MDTPKIIADRPPDVKEIHIIWMTTGLSCDGDSVSVTAASLPSIEDVVLGAIPGLPKVHLHNPVLAYEVGDDFMKYWFQAAEGKLEPFVLVLEGSVPNEGIKSEGYWAAMGTDPHTGQPIKTSEWIDRLAPKATAVIAAGTCATYGGIHAMQGNTTGAMGLADYLGWNWRSKAGLPVVNCNVTKRGWMAGIGGCPNVGGICIACTMPGFPDKFMPFMDEPPGSKVSTMATGAVYGPVIRKLRSITLGTVDKEPKWRTRGAALKTGYRPDW